MSEENKSFIGFIFFGALVILFLFLTSCAKVNDYIGQKNDWFGEQILEKFIDYETGIDVDLTP